jgi:hypothetical protein
MHARGTPQKNCLPRTATPNLMPGAIEYCGNNWNSGCVNR